MLLQCPIPHVLLLAGSDLASCRRQAEQAGLRVGGALYERVTIF